METISYRIVDVAMFDNDNDALIPEQWAAEALITLNQMLVMGAIVYRDFDPQIQEYGDTVNTHRPKNFKMTRKTDADDVTTQDAQSDKIPVKLDQHGHVSFIIKDGEASRAFKDLASYYLTPAIQAMAEGIEACLMSQRYRFLSNVIGKIGTDLSKSSATAVQQKKLELKWPKDNQHYAVLTPEAQANLMDVDGFTNASAVGDNGTALQEGSIGRKFGTNWIGTNSNPTIATGNTVVTGAVNLTAGYVAGDTVLVVDGFTGALVTGSWCTIGGDMTPQLITAHTETTGDTTGITLSPGLRNDVVNNAVITVYSPGAVNLTAGYAAGWTKDIVVDGFSVAPKEGQLISFGTTDSRYGAVVSPNSPATTSLMLDRNLYAGVANDVVVGVGPAGNYSFVLHPQAIALVNRPLALPGSDLARAAVVNLDGFSMRVVITYDGKAQGHRVTIDCLYGVEVLNENLGIVLLS